MHLSSLFTWPFRVMPPKLTGKALLERWKTFIEEHKSAPTETGGAGHALARCTRDKLAAGHLSRSEIAELNRLKGEVTRASSTNSGDAHPAVASGVGAKPGAASHCDSGDAHPAASWLESAPFLAGAIAMSLAHFLFQYQAGTAVMHILRRCKQKRIAVMHILRRVHLIECSARCAPFFSCLT